MAENPAVINTVTPALGSSSPRDRRRRSRPAAQPVADQHGKLDQVDPGAICANAQVRTNSSSLNHPRVMHTWWIR